MSTVGRFQLLDSLGVTATGESFVARDPALDRLVIVKRCARSLSDDASIRHRFRTEAELMARVQSPHCVRVFDFLEIDGDAWFVTELVEGTTLGRLLELEGRLRPEHALVALYGALLGLGDIHAEGLRHSDVRPETIVVTADGRSRLADLGQMTVAGARAGAPTASAAYTAPELVRGESGDARSDLYSIGCVLFTCLEGRPPFAAATADAVLRQHVEVAAPVPQHAPQGLVDLTSACMAKDPSMRPQTARDAAAALDQAARDAYGADWWERGALAGLLGLAGGVVAGIVVPGLLTGGAGAPAVAGASALSAAGPAPGIAGATPATAVLSGQQPAGPSAGGTASTSGAAPGTTAQTMLRAGRRRPPLGRMRKLILGVAGAAAIASAVALPFALRGTAGNGVSISTSSGTVVSTTASTQSPAASTLTVDPGWRVADYATDFPSDGSAAGPRGLVFDRQGRLLVVDVNDKVLYRIPNGGGSATSAALVKSTELFGLASTGSGRLFGVLSGGDIIEISPDDGHVLRVVTSLAAGGAGIAIDPSMDALYVSNDAGVVKVAGVEKGPATATLLMAGGYDGITVAPDGTMYVVTYGASGGDKLLRVRHAALAAATGDTNTAVLKDADVEMVAPVENPDGTALSGDLANPSIVINRTDGTIVELTPAPAGQPRVTTLMSGGTRGDFVTVGPDGCLYATQIDRVVRVSHSDGSCTFLATTPQPPAPSRLPVWIIVAILVISILILLATMLAWLLAAEAAPIAYAFGPGQGLGLPSSAEATLPSSGGAPHPPDAGGDG